MKTTSCPVAFLTALIVAGSACTILAETESTVVVSHIPRVAVQSIALAGVGFSKRRHILEIQFIRGSVYRYYDVPPSVYRDLMAAESKTGYYVANIKRSYRSVRVRPRIKNGATN